MGLKTGKSWLDANDFEKAKNILLKARKDAETLLSVLPEEMQQGLLSARDQNPFCS